MSEMNQLLRSLFEHEQREHMNVKFLRGDSEDISHHQLCETAASAFLQIDSGQSERDEDFSEEITQVAMVHFVKAL